MVNVLNIAASALNAYQSALDITGNNISKIGVGSYTRQRPVFEARPMDTGFGTGVDVKDIRRNADRFANQQLRETVTVKFQYDTFYQQSLQIDKLMSSQGSNIGSVTQSFFDALGQLNDMPDNLASRSILIKQSQMLVEQYNTIQANLDEDQANNREQVKDILNEINRLAASIANLNQRISVTPTPDLLDQRDDQLKELSQFTHVYVLDQGADGFLVSVGSGEFLVSGAAYRQLAVSNEPGENGIPGILIQNPDGSSVDVTSNLQSGMLGGLLDYGINILGNVSQMMGQMAIGMSMALNVQHQLGIDLNNQPGGLFFNDFNDPQLQLTRSVPFSTNAGTANFSVAISDISQTQLSDYQLVISDVATQEVRLIRQSDGAVTVLNLTNTPPTPPAGQLEIDGLTITVDNVGNMANGDIYTISPFRGASRDFALNITDPHLIAMAAPVRQEANINNTGNGSIQLGTVFDMSSVNKEFQIQFSSPTEYNILNVTDGTSSGPFTFTPNASNTILIPDGITPSYSLVITGAPQTGDLFTTTYNAGGYGDNRNGLLLFQTQQDKFFEGDTQSLSDRYSNLIAEVGSLTNQGKLRSDAADVLFQQASDYRESISGVNLETEEATLMYYQKAYFAAGKLLNVANEVMEYLFAMMR